MTEKQTEQPLFLQERPAGFDRWDMEDRLYPRYQDFTESALVLYRHAPEIKEKVIGGGYYGEDSPKSYRSMRSIYNLHEERRGKPPKIEIEDKEESEIIEFLENSLFKRNPGEFGDEYSYEFDPLTFMTICETHPLGIFDEFLEQDTSDKPTADKQITLKKNLLDNPAKVRFAYLTTLAIICSKSNEQSRLESLDTLSKIENHQFKDEYDFHISDVDLGAHKQEFTLQVDKKGAMPGRVIKLSAESCAELRAMLEERSKEIKSGEFSRLGASLQLSLVMNILPSAIGPEKYNSTYRTYLQPIELAIARGNVAEANNLFNTLGESLDEEELGVFKVQFEQEARVFTNLLRGIGTPRGLSLAMGVQQALGEFTETLGVSKIKVDDIDERKKLLISDPIVGTSSAVLEKGEEMIRVAGTRSSNAISSTNGTRIPKDFNDEYMDYQEVFGETDREEAKQQLDAVLKEILSKRASKLYVHMTQELVLPKLVKQNGFGVQLDVGCIGSYIHELGQEFSQYQGPDNLFDATKPFIIMDAQIGDDYFRKDGKKVSRTTTGNHKYTVVQGFTSFSNPNVLAIWVPNEQVRKNYIEWISSWTEEKREKLLQGRNLNEFIVHSIEDLKRSDETISS